jgi:predicted acyltransferase
MRIVDLAIISLIFLIGASFLFRRSRIKNNSVSELKMITQSLVLGTLVGILVACLYTGDIWSVIHLK